MNSDLRSNNSPGEENGFVRTVKFLVRLTLTAILLFALASLLWFGWQQLDRWMERMSRRTVLLESDTDYLLDQMATSQAQIALLTTRLASEQELTAAQGAALNSQVKEQESSVHQLEELASAGGIMSSTLSVLAEGVAALQGDANENMGQIDQIGGQADAAIIRSGTLETRLATLEAMAREPGEEVIQLQVALRWFHLRELISSAQQRLVESNPGLAAVDVERAYLTAAAFQEESPEEEDQILSIIMDRLDLAFSSLPDDPASAARDLESAGASIDQMLAEMLGIEVIQVAVEELEILNGTAAPTDAGGSENGESETGGTPSAVPGTPEASPTTDE